MNLGWNLASWWQWAMLLAIPPLIVLLYFLKLKREPLAVPSTYLWSRTIEDMHVNSIWQRLRKNLLLFLQLLLLLFAILACINPNWRSTKLEDGRAIFLIDNSASSNATDLGRSRLEEAKRLAKELIRNELKSGDKGMIIAFSDDEGARTIQSYTANKSRLISKLDAIKPTHRRTNLKQALNFASGLANPNRSSFGDTGDVNAAEAQPAALFIFSDGRVNGKPDFSLGNLKPTYVMVGKKDAKNVAISAFQATKNPEKPDQLQVYAGLRNHSTVEQQVSIELFRDDSLIDASELTLGAETEGGKEFSLTSIDTGVLRLKIEANDDDLNVDDEAFAVLDTTQRAKILILTEGNPFLVNAFNTERITKFADIREAKPNYLTDEKYQTEAAEGVYDLVIFDKCAPATADLMPFSNTVFFGVIPPAEKAVANPDGTTPEAKPNEVATSWQRSKDVEGPTIIDVDQSHPVMQFVNPSDILIGEAIAIDPPEGATTLIDTDLGVIAAIATRDTVQDLVIGFSLLGRDEAGNEFYNTTWVRNDPSYPIFIQNLLNQLAGVSEAREIQIYRPGQLVELRLDTPSKTLSLKRPDGSTAEVGRGRTGAFTFSSTDYVGIYELKDVLDEEKTHRIAVNLFDDIESNISPVAELAFEDDVKISSDQRGTERTRRETWKWLTLLAMVVLLAEWYIYNRRVYL